MDVGKLKERIDDDLEDTIRALRTEIADQVTTTLSDLQPQDVFDVSELEEWAEENGFKKDDDE